MRLNSMKFQELLKAVNSAGITGASGAGSIARLRLTWCRVKGCEWTVVHIIHAADGMIPSDMALRDEAGVEEERRLFYVAMTRAKDTLYVYFPLRYYHRRASLSDQHGYAQLTRFASEKVRALFEEVTEPIDERQETVEERSADAPGHVESIGARLSRLWSD